MIRIPLWRKIHPSFKLNGIHYGFDALHEVAYDLIKEGTAFERAIGDFLSEWIAGNPAIVAQTSGSTGAPKSIPLKKEYMVNSAIETGRFFNLNPGSSALLCLPVSGIAGKMMLVRAMVLGWELDYAEPSSKPLENLIKSYDFSAMVPLQVENSLEQLAQIKTLIVGGAPVSHSLSEKLRSVNTQVYETYGMTETITHVAVKAIQNSKFKIENSYNPTIEQSNFRALPNITFSQDNRNCLIIDAPKISDEKIITNDIVELIGDTQFNWLGRYDSIINSGGIKLIPEQIEQKLVSLIASRFFVAGIPDKILGQKLVLVIEDAPFDTSELLLQIRTLKGLNTYEVPKKIMVVPSFIETAGGKIQRKKTLQQVN